jgi:hypothetical protein
MEARVPCAAELSAESDFSIELLLSNQLWRDSLELNINTEH